MMLYSGNRVLWLRSRIGLNGVFLLLLVFPLMVVRFLVRVLGG